MSKIGKLPVVILEGVTVDIDGRRIRVRGPLGEVSRDIPDDVEIEVSGGKVVISAKSDSKMSRALWGTTRAHVYNMVYGVVNGWKKELEIVGTGYRAQLDGAKLILSIGYSHPVEIEAPEGIAFKLEKTKIFVSGVDKEVVGEISAKIRRVRPPEPYKGKGIRYSDEEVRRKAGKTAKAQGAV